MPIVRPDSLSQIPVTPDLFGANILATVDRLGADGTYDDVIQSIGATHVRYPGGSLTEEFFDLSDPTRDMVESAVTGEASSFLPYDEFMGWAEDNNLSVTIVLPTLTQMGQATDANGDRFPDIEEDVLRQFIADTLDGKYGAPEIKAFEIGNEYFFSGEMSSVEYGRLASEMAAIIQDEIDTHPQAAQFAELDILVQMGVNHGFARLDQVYADVGTGAEQLEAVEADYDITLPADKFLFGSGEVAWARVQSALVANEFDTAEEREAVDAIVAHVYGRGLDAESSWYFDYRVIDAGMAETFPDVTKYVTEWNTKSAEFTTDEAERFGLEQAHEMLHMVHQMTNYDVEAAHVWPVQQSTATDLSGPEGQTDLTVAGEMFRIMSEHLPGTYSVTMDGARPGFDEVSTLHSDYWMFAGPEKSSLFVFADAEEAEVTSLDLSEVFASFGTVSVQKLGVEPGDDPVSRDAQPVLESMDPNAIFSGKTADITLEPYEILHISFENPTYSAGLGNMIPDYVEPPFDADLGDGPIIPDRPQHDEVEYESPDGSENPDFDADDGDSGFGSVLGFLLFLPLLFALG